MQVDTRLRVYPAEANLNRRPAESCYVPVEREVFG
jgi:hypothetical protein